MLLHSKNSDALESFSEQLDIEGRSLWQDARRRFINNKAALASVCLLFLITLFVILPQCYHHFFMMIPTGI